MTKLEIFKNLSIEEKKEIIDSYLTEDKKAEEMTIIQYLFLKCVTICEETNAAIESDELLHWLRA